MFLNQALQYGVKNNLITLVKFLLQLGADPNSKTEGKSLLAHALNNIEDDEEVASILLKNGANIESELDFKSSLLIDAIIENERFGDISYKVLFLVKNGAQLNFVSSDGSTPLSLAFNHKNIDLFKYLLSKGASADSFVNGVPLLSKAIQTNQHAVVDRLLDSEADVNLTDRQGNTPLHALAKKNDPHLLAILISKGASINQRNTDGESPLLIAIKHDQYSMAKQLIIEGANINYANKSGETPLMLAIRNKSFVSYLISRSVLVNKSDVHRQSALSKALESKKIEVALILLQNGAVLDPILFPSVLRLYDERNNASYELLKETLERFDIEINEHKIKGTPLVEWALDNKQFRLLNLLTNHGGRIKELTEDPLWISHQCRLALPNKEEYNRLISLTKIIPDYEDRGDYKCIKIGFINKDNSGLIDSLSLRKKATWALPFPKHYIPIVKMAAKAWEQSCDHKIKFTFTTNTSSEVDIMIGFESAKTVGSETLGTTYFGAEKNKIYLLLNNPQIDKVSKNSDFESNPFSIFPSSSLFKNIFTESPRPSQKKFILRMLHVLSHELGHCLGIDHPFEITTLKTKFMSIENPELCSVMNYLHEIKPHILSDNERDYRPYPGLFDGAICKKVYSNNIKPNHFTRKTKLTVDPNDYTSKQLVTLSLFHKKESFSLNLSQELSFFLLITLLLMCTIKACLKKGDSSKNHPTATIF